MSSKKRMLNTVAVIPRHLRIIEINHTHADAKIIIIHRIDRSRIIRLQHGRHYHGEVEVVCFILWAGYYLAALYF